ncbi:MAG: hypothetical protein VKJ46_00460 [Leptolyngbyaceae bacterium]|nr:hypothetical protein [Leptolyngbyaceae bacterium]
MANAERRRRRDRRIDGIAARLKNVDADLSRVAIVGGHRPAPSFGNGGRGGGGRDEDYRSEKNNHRDRETHPKFSTHGVKAE